MKKPRRYPVKYQGVEEIDGRQVIVEKVLMVAENDRRKKLNLLLTLLSIGKDIDRMNALLSLQFAKRPNTLGTNVGYGNMFKPYRYVERAWKLRKSSLRLMTIEP